MEIEVSDWQVTGGTQRKSKGSFLAFSRSWDTPAIFLQRRLFQCGLNFVVQVHIPFTSDVLVVKVSREN